MRSALLVLICMTAVLAGLQQPVDAAVVLASDDYESSSGVFYGGTSGTGFGAHTDFSGSGGIFWQNAVGPKIDGNGSLGMFSGGTTESFGRAVNDTSAYGTFPVATFDVSMRFNIPNSNSSFKGFNLKNALGGSFGSNELISVGMTSAANDGLLVTDSTGQHTLSFGTELRGTILDVNVRWAIATGAYTVTANIRSQSPFTISGTLQNPGSFVPNAVGFIHSDVGGSGNDIMFDNLKVSAIPEVSPVLAIPSAAVIAGLGMAARRGFRRRLAVQVA